MRHLYFLTLIFLMLVTGSCSTRKYIPVVQTRNSEHINIKTDSVHVIDSIFIYINGDTVRETRFRDRWHDRTVCDTVWLTDTIPKIVTVEVEKQLNFWDRIKLRTWKYFATVIILICFIFIIKKRFGAS